MDSNKSLEEYKAGIAQRIAEISPILQKIALGDISTTIPVPEKDDEFTELIVGINLMVEDLQEKIKDAENTKAALSNLLEDLNEEKVRLTEAGAKDEAMLTSIGDGMVVTDEYGAIAKINSNALQLLDFSENEVLGKAITKAIQAVDENGTPLLPQQRAVTEALMTGEKVSKRMWYLKRDGTKIPVSVTVTPIIINDKPVGSIEIFRDITHEKELEHLKDEFVSIASHELRTPMTAIKGFISMILDGDYGEVSDNIKQPLVDIAAATERLIHLVNDMLNLSRIEAGRLKYILSVFQIDTAINEIVSILQPIVKDREILLKAEGMESVSVLADSDKIKQILNNLIGNALKFTDKGSIVVSTKTEGELVKVFVTDTGAGIADDDQKKLFGKFQQISSQQEGRPAGTGLGLYISKQIAQKMGGDMWLEKSEIGKGSIFAFSVPLANSALAAKIKSEIDKEMQGGSDKVDLS